MPSQPFSILITKAQLMSLSLNNNCHSTAPFQSPIQVSSTSIEQNVSIQENLNAAISKNDCDFQQQEQGMISGGNFTNGSFNFKETATAFTELLQGINVTQKNIFYVQVDSLFT